MLSGILAIAIALTLAAHDVGDPNGWPMVGAYVYWIVRLGMSFLVVIGAHAALSQVMTRRSSPFAHAGLAAALSFPPFVMAVSMLNLIIGDLALLRADPNVLISRVGIEAAALIDDHVIICAILLTPYIVQALRPAPAPAPRPADAGEAEAAADQPTHQPGLFLACQPPVRGEVLAAEAQEHYVKLKATGQGGMALYRFGDAVRDLGHIPGMQIHRSHWVADNAVAAVTGKRGSLKIELTDGEIIPVSRRYELEVEARYGGRGRRDAD